MNRYENAIVAAEIERLAGLYDGKLTPETVVEAAKDVKNPLHDEFEWDDTVAGHLFRVEHARKLMRSVTYVRHDVETRTCKPIMPLVRDPDVAHNKQGYLETKSIVNNVDKQKGVMSDELTRIIANLKRAKEIAEYYKMQEIIGALNLCLSTLATAKLLHCEREKGE